MFTLDQLLSKFFTEIEVTSIKNSKVDIGNFINNYNKFVINNLKYPIKLVYNLDKLKKLGVTVNSIIDLEKVKQIDPNKLFINDLNINEIRNSLIIVKKTNISSIINTYNSIQFFYQ